MSAGIFAVSSTNAITAELPSRDPALPSKIDWLSTRNAIALLTDTRSGEHQEPRPSLLVKRPTMSQTINSTCLRRFLVLAAVKILKRIVPSHGAVIFISSKFCIKFGLLRHLPEAWTIRFIARHTSIPVPKAYCAFALAWLRIGQNESSVPCITSIYSVCKEPTPGLLNSVLSTEHLTNEVR